MRNHKIQFMLAGRSWVKCDSDVVLNTNLSSYGLSSARDSLFLHVQNNINYLNTAIIMLGILISSFRKGVKLLLWWQNCSLMHRCLSSICPGTIVIETAFLSPGCIASFPCTENISRICYLSLWRALYSLEKEVFFDNWAILSKGLLMFYFFHRSRKTPHLLTFRFLRRLSNLCWSGGLFSG